MTTIKLKKEWREIQGQSDTIYEDSIRPAEPEQKSRPLIFTNKKTKSEIKIYEHRITGQ